MKEIDIPSVTKDYSKEFIGSYSSGFISFTADSEENNIFITDGLNNIFYKGTFEAMGDREFKINGEKIGTEIIQIECKGNLQKQFTLLLEGQEYVFTKVSDIPTIFSDIVYE